MKKSFDIIQYPFMIKKKYSIRWYRRNITQYNKSDIDNASENIILSRDSLKDFPLSSGKKKCPLTPVLSTQFCKC